MKDPEAMDVLLGVMAHLRGPDGCPWDRKQDLQSLRRWLLEESYEVLEAMEAEDPNVHRDELGDLLFQVVFQSRIQEEAGHFDFSEVARGISDKLKRRHPHVFGDLEIENQQALRAIWSSIKQQEGRKSAIDGVPRAAPALLRAFRVSAKAAAVGFDWKSSEGVWRKFDEERAELREALERGSREEQEEEMGDLLFTLANLCRHLQLDPEAALRRAVKKFERRFRRMEARAELRGLSAEALEALWLQSKEELSSS